MVPAGLTISALFTDATSVVTQFSALILLVGGITIGVWAVRFLMRSVRKAVRG